MTIDATGTTTPSVPAALDGGRPEPRLERRGRLWLIGSFVFCPCHLPLTLAALAWIFGGSVVGVVVREHIWLTAAIVTLAWVAGTAQGFRVLRRARQGTCPLPAGSR